MKRQNYGQKDDFMFFIDANIFLEVMLSDKRNEECKELFARIHKNQIKAATSDFIVYTCLIQIENKSSEAKMIDFVLFLDNMPGIEVCSPSYGTLYSAFGIMKKYGLDFDDALVVATMKSSGIKEIMSFDGHFDKINEIKRVEPKDIN